MIIKEAASLAVSFIVGTLFICEPGAKLIPELCL